MKKRKVNRVSVKDREREASLILQFALDRVVEDPGERGIPTLKLFKAYQEYLKEKDLPESVLSVDGFGRLFPKNFARGQLTYSGKMSGGKVLVKMRNCKGILGVRLVD